MTAAGIGQVRDLQCVRCGEAVECRRDVYVCPACGGNLQVRYDLARASRLLTRDALARDPERSIWRYAAMLPVDGRLAGPPVGWTPLVEAPHLARQLGLRRVQVKDDGKNPSASFKDRASAIALQRARETGHDLVVGASTGNAASSTATLAAANGLRARIFIPAAAPRAKVAQLVAFGAEVIAVDGTYDQAFDLCLAACARYGWYNRNTGFNPFTREGKKTVSYELAEQRAWQVPDVVAVAVGDGNILSGVGKGFAELLALGLIDRVPRLLAVQAAGSAAIVDAWRTGLPIAPVSGQTVADSISVSLPRDGEAAVQAIRESKGWGVTVEDAAILDAIPELAQGSGVFAEPAGAAPWAGLKQAVAQGLIGKDAEVVVLVTGSGLKDVGAVLGRVGELRAVSPDPARVDALFEQP